jgi:hypothetical protein
MTNAEPGGGCALYVTLMPRPPPQSGVTLRAAVIGVAVEDVGGGVVVVSVTVVVVEVHDDSLCWPEADPMTVCSKLVVFMIVAVATHV